MPTNTEIVKAAVAALNDHDVARLRTYWAPDGWERFPDATCHGPDAIGRYFQETFDAIPDLHIEPKAFAAEGDEVFMRYAITGTHTGGAFKGVAATGRRIEVPGIDQFTVRDGRIVSNFVVFDQMEIGRQLGLLPPADSAADKALKAAFNGVTAVRRKLGRAG